MNKQQIPVHPEQHGLAAIEFAFVLSVLLLLLYGILGFGLLFWMQQKVLHITGDSARQAVVASMSGHPHAAREGCAQVARHVDNDGLLGLLGVGQVSCTPSAANQSCPDDPVASCASITVIADVSNWPVLAVVRGLAGVVRTGDFPEMLNQLSATAVVRIRGDAQ